MGVPPLRSRPVHGSVATMTTRSGTFQLPALRAAADLGLLELSLGDAAAALPPLRRARELAERLAIDEPSMLTFLLDEVEAHALLDDAASATAVLMTFDRRCAGNRAPWISPLALRARGLIEAAGGDLGTARATLEAAVAGERDLPFPLDRARARLSLGRLLCRLRHYTEARAELEAALAAFLALDASHWAARAEDELERIGG